MDVVPHDMIYNIVTAQAYLI